MAPGDIEQQRAVADRSRDRVGLREPEAGIPGGRSMRNPASSRLDPEETTSRGGNTNRPATVAGVSRRHVSSRDSCGGAATRTTGRPSQIPRVVRRAMQFGFGDGHQPELGCVRLSEDDEASLLVSGDDLAIKIGSELHQIARSAAERDTRHCRAQILEQKRHASQRAFWNRTVGKVHRPFVELVDDGIDRRVGALDAGDRRL